MHYCTNPPNDRLHLRRDCVKVTFERKPLRARFPSASQRRSRVAGNGSWAAATAPNFTPNTNPWGFITWLSRLAQIAVNRNYSAPSC